MYRPASGSLPPIAYTITALNPESSNHTVTMEDMAPSSSRLEGDVSEAFSSWLEIKPNSGWPRHGLCFQNLSCHGFISSTLFQSTFSSYALAIPRFLIGLLNRRPKRRVQILQDLDGLILPGEMLLVLGRPGSGCSTFLKSLAGDDHGFCIGDKTQINYGGSIFFQPILRT